MEQPDICFSYGGGGGTEQVNSKNTEMPPYRKESTMERECENERALRLLKHIRAAIWGEWRMEEKKKKAKAGREEKCMERNSSTVQPSETYFNDL